MITLNKTKEVLERKTCYKTSHSLRVFHIADGGYLVTCDNCDLRTTIPVGERLRGWNDDFNAEMMDKAA